MRIPEELDALLHQGLIQSVVRPLLAGKEAQIYLVESEGELRVAKVYKDMETRSFKNRADYTEGRKVRNSRDQRAMNKKTRYGKAQEEAAWRSTEAEVIQKLHAAGVRVPTPYHFIDSVLVMELVTGPDGGSAPQLGESRFNRDEAKKLFEILVNEVKTMLCMGVVHGDLSQFNVLASANGPVIIDFPQAVDPTKNQNARRLFLRDVKNLRQFFGQKAPELYKTRYGEEMWDLHERGELSADTQLTGKYREPKRVSTTDALLEEIAELEREARAKREALGLGPARPVRSVPIAPRPAQNNAKSSTDGGPKKRRRRRRKPNEQGGQSAQSGQAQNTSRSKGTGQPTSAAQKKSGSPSGGRNRRRGSRNRSS